MSTPAASGIASARQPLPVSTAFIQDDFVAQCSHAQKRTFLRTGIVPSVGQRVELTAFLDSTERGGIPFRLSGEVTVVHPMPSWKTNDDPAINAEGTSSYLRPSCSPEDCGPSRGSSVLAFLLRKDAPSYRLNAQRDGSVPNLNGIWGSVLSTEKKDELMDKIVKKFGALHGQRVVCEGRLNFDYEIRRGRNNVNGPWNDLIPIDGRDIWRFALVADDSMHHMWRVDPNSFVNLGRYQRNRNWPWSDGEILPFPKPNSDLPLTSIGPNGSLPIHVCKGPYGCDADDHRHSFPAIAA